MERICKIAVAFFLLSASCFGQWQVGQRSFRPSGAAPTGPVADHRWQVNSASNTCAATPVACTNGAQINTLADLGTVGGIAFARSPVATQSPTYNTNVLNSLAVGTWASASSQDLYNLSGVTGTSVSVFAVFYLNTLASTEAIIGGESGGGSPLLRMDTTGHAEFLVSSTASLVTGAATYATGTWYAIEAVCNPAVSGACQLYTCSAGTATLDASSSSTSTFAHPITAIGSDNAGNYLNGKLAEIGASASIWTGAQINQNCAYIHSEYGI